MKTQMNKIPALLSFVRKKPLESNRSVIAWWEMRRPFYNFVVGAAGFCMLLFCFVSAVTGDLLFHDPIGGIQPFFAVFGILVYGIAANIFYTGGWIAEIAVRTFRSKEEGDKFGARSFAYGTLFSILLTLSPVGLVILAWMFKLLLAL
jgi:hypothetical protein